MAASASYQQVAFQTALTDFEQSLAAKTVDPAKRPAQHELADLRAQQRMADATELLAVLTFWQVLIGSAGTIGLGVTLFFNFKALKYAADQATETQRQTQLSQKLGLIELRAYVAVEDFKLVGSGPGRWKGSATVRNRGQTPALNVNVRMRLAEVARQDKDIPWDEAGIQKSALHRSTIASGGRMGPSGAINVGSASLQAAAQYQVWIHLAVLVEYEDVFGNKYRRRASVCFTGPDLGVQSPTTQGNDETISERTGYALELHQSDTAQGG